MTKSTIRVSTDMRRKFVGVVAIVSVLAVLAAACSNDNKGVAVGLCVNRHYT